ncbi:MAG: hypothetical protein V4537_14205 [Pseudomonadota bacterium]
MTNKKTAKKERSPVLTALLKRDRVWREAANGAAADWHAGAATVPHAEIESLVAAGTIAIDDDGGPFETIRFRVEPSEYARSIGAIISVVPFEKGRR